MWKIRGKSKKTYFWVLMLLKYRYLLRLNSDKSHTVFQRHYDKMQTQTIMTLQEIIKENTISTNRKGEDWWMEIH